MADPVGGKSLFFDESHAWVGVIISLGGFDVLKGPPNLSFVLRNGGCQWTSLVWAFVLG